MQLHAYRTWETMASLHYNLGNLVKLIDFDEIREDMGIRSALFSISITRSS